MRNLFICIAAILIFASCSKEETMNDLASRETVLNVHPNVVNISTRAAISAFPNGTALGLFVTAGALGTNYNGVSTNANVRSVYNGSVWSQSPAVYLSSANATVYAYYPYSASYTNGTTIPVEHGTQTDYMHGTHATGQTSVNNENPNVNLTMKHALSLLQFQISKGNYTGAGILTKIEITNKSGKTALFSEGTMNITTGTMTYSSNKNQSAMVTTSHTLPVTTSVLVLPVTSTIAAGDIQINFVIDGKTYTYLVTANTKWEQGKINTYNVTLNGADLIVNNVGITDWTAGNNGNVVLQ